MLSKYFAEWLKDGCHCEPAGRSNHILLSLRGTKCRSNLINNNEIATVVSLPRNDKGKLNNFPLSTFHFPLPKAAFTLAEMMVVLLVMTLALAAMAPVITTKIRGNTKGASSNNVWHWAINNSDGWFASADAPRALIGAQSAGAGDNAKLIINTAGGSNYAHIMFKNANAPLATLRVTNSSVILSNSPNTGENDIVVGIGALPATNYSGNGNVAIGTDSLRHLSKGVGNIAIGKNSGANITPSANNTISIGSEAGTQNNGIAIGSYARATLINHPFDSSFFEIGGIAIGSSPNSVTHTCARGGGIAIGNGYRYKINSDDDWINSGGIWADPFGIAIGSETFAGVSDVAIGKKAGSYTGGNPFGHNVAIGENALHRAYDTPSYSGSGKNIAIGYNANTNFDKRFGDDTVTNGVIIATDTIAIGPETIAHGDSSIAIGNSAKVENSDSIAIGKAAWARDSGIAIGPRYSDEDGTTTTATLAYQDAVAIGKAAKGGYDDISIGYMAGGNGGSVELCGDNIAIGKQALFHGSCVNNFGFLRNSVNNNIAIGNGANNQVLTKTVQYTLAIGTDTRAYSNYDISIGKDAGSTRTFTVNNGTTGNNIAIGNQALSINDEGGYNIAIGHGANAKGDNDTIELSDSIAIGRYAKTVTNNSIAIGYNACSQATGRNVICIGANSGPTSENSAKDLVYLGTSEHTVIIGDLTAKNIQHSGSITQSSDKRLKNVGKEFTSGLDKIKQLKIFNYTFKKDDKKTRHVGVIAQDLQKIFPDAVTKDKDGFLQVRMEDMFYALINAVKELDAKVTAVLNEVKELKTQVTEILRSAQNDRKILNQVQNDNKQLKSENKQLQKTLNQVQSDNKELKARLEKLEAKLK